MSAHISILKASAMSTNSNCLPPDGSRSQARNSSPSWPENVPIPESFLCPITNRLMKQPVIDREGISYEKSAIMSHLYQGLKHSPVTKNPLRKEDLVDNKGLQMTIDAALKSVTEKADSNRRNSNRRKLRRSRISNSIRGSMRKLASSLKHSGHEDHVLGPPPLPSNDPGSSVDNSLTTGGSAEEADAHSEGEQNDELPAKLQNRNDRNHLGGNLCAHPKYVPRIESGDLDAVARRQRLSEIDGPKSAEDRFEEKLKSKLSNEATARVKYVPKIGSGGRDERLNKKLPELKSSVPESAEDRFEEKLRKKLANDATARAKYLSRIKSGDLNEEARRDTDVLQNSRRKKCAKKKGPSSHRRGQAFEEDDTGESLYSSVEEVEFKKQRNNEGMHHSIVENEHQTSNIGKAGRPRRLSIDDMAVMEYTKQTLRQTNESNNARKSTDDIGMKTSRQKHSEKKRGSTSPCQDNRKNEFTVLNAVANADSNKELGSRAASNKVRESKQISTFGNRNDLFGTGADAEEEVNYVQVQEERRRSRRNRRSMLDQKLKESLTSSVKTKAEDSHGDDHSMRPYVDSSSDNHEQVSAVNAASDDVADCSRIQGERNITGGNRRVALDQKVEQVRASFTSNEGSTIEDRRKFPNSAQLSPFLSKRCLSDLIIEDEDEDNQSVSHALDCGSSSLPCNIKRESESRIISSTGLFDASWSDLEEEISQAQCLSMKVNKCDALKIQCELESRLQADNDVHHLTTIEEDCGAATARHQSKGRRGETRQQNHETSSTISDKVNYLLPIVEGSNKTRSDVLNALKAADGNRDKALTVLLGFDDSFLL